MARFFIDRPIFAWVVAIIIMMAGTLALYSLPIAQYPSIAPPEIAITATYPGASAKTLEDSVTQVIEQQMKGIDRLNYIYSTSDATGQATITLSFEGGTNVDIAQVQVQNKLQLAMPLLPEAVQRQGIKVAKSTKNYLLVIGFVSEDGNMTGADIGDYIASNIQDPISRVAGVGGAAGGSRRLDDRPAHAIGSGADQPHGNGQHVGRHGPLGRARVHRGGAPRPRRAGADAGSDPDRASGLPRSRR